jgi:hypothetical protein
VRDPDGRRLSHLGAFSVVTQEVIEVGYLKTRRLTALALNSQAAL